ncbi:MAG TPA: SRPBCC family protein, partial [Terriglobales bacterium]|nr:SRPBCC family protein [Terriglobales bacterium]
MKERSVTHSTFVIERSYPAAVNRVFAAFSDPAKKRCWFAEGEELAPEEFQMDFRVAGRERVRFCSKDGKLTFTNDTLYLDIAPDMHIVFAYTMSVGDQRISSSQATVEFLAAQKGTNLIFTDQGAYFKGADGPQIRQDGWTKLL